MMLILYSQTIHPLLTNYYSQPNRQHTNPITFTMIAKCQRVAFAENITIIEFPMVMGDHPSVSSGAPVQIGWIPQATFTINLDVYEHYRRGTRRQIKKLILKTPQRTNILLRAGFSLKAIVAASITADLIRMSRRDALNKKQGSWERFSTIHKGLVKSVKNIVVAPMRRHCVPACAMTA